MDASLKNEYQRTITQIVNGFEEITFPSSFKKEYLVWNHYTAKFFFNETKASKDVLLYVNQEVINEIGKEFNGSVSDFISSIKEGLRDGGLGLWNKIKKYSIIDQDDLLNWRDAQFPSFPGKYLYPPYIGFLTFFVLAAGKDGDYSPLAYYARLWDLLGVYDRDNTYSGFDNMHILWEDLEIWCNVDQEEELGRFTLREPYVKQWKHVGLPINQLVISEDERKKLPFIYYNADLDPLDPPPPEVMKNILINYESVFFNSRTSNILNGETSETRASRDFLLDLVLNDLNDWDGSIPEIKRGSRSRQIKTRRFLPQALRICLDFSGQSRSYLRFKTKREFPEDGFEFEYNGENSEFIGKKIQCSETSTPKNREGDVSWSTSLMIQDVTSPSILQATRFDWTKNHEFSDQRFDYKIKLKGSTIKLFKRGIDERLAGWVETNRLVRNRRYYLACKKNLDEEIEAWGNIHCDLFEKKQFLGIPSDWSLYEIYNAKKSFKKEWLLTLSDKTQLEVIGGIRIGRGNSFLNFAPPSFQIDTVLEDEEILCFVEGELHHRKLNFDKKTLLYSIPKKLMKQCNLRIELRKKNSQQLLQKKNVNLINPEIPSGFSFADIFKLDKIGNLLSAPEAEIQDYIQGTNITGDNNSSIDLSTLPIEALSTKLIILGANIGEIVFSSEKNFSWEIVWILSKIRRDSWEVNSTGILKNVNTVPSSIKLQKNTCLQRDWISAILNTPGLKKPRLFPLKKLWCEYENAARKKKTKNIGG